MNIKSLFKICVSTLIFTLIMVLSCITAFTAVRVDIDKISSLKLQYKEDGNYVSGADVKIYRVADISEGARFTLSGDFSKYSIKINDLDSTGWKNAANTLDTYVKADDINHYDSKKTDSKGEVLFENLKTGLYLVRFETIKIGDITYKSDPVLISLPSLDDNNWIYDVNAYPKMSSEDEPGGGGNNSYIDVEVIKVWNDDGNKEKRPEKIEVELLKDGKVYDTVELDEDNYWRYEWKRLNKKYEWKVVEKTVPDGYTVEYSGNKTLLKITNSYIEDIPNTPPPKGEKPPDEPETPPETPPDTPNIPEVPIEEPPVPTGPMPPDEEVPPETPETPKEELPQTGMIQWPIPVFAALGLLVFGYGWYITFSKKDGKNDK